ncbi:MAG: hypothetical protein QM527_09445 [Alphaproteobacteria bacterium]|nr:hypothetical protein [Alphaproteobacteria bacterium]
MGIEKMLEEKFDQGLLEGREEGREEGRITGQCQYFQKMMVMRFGPLPSEVLSRIQQADATQLERWGHRLFHAQSMQGVFADVGVTRIDIKPTRPSVAMISAKGN